MLVDNMKEANWANYISKQNQGTLTPSTIKHHLHHEYYQSKDHQQHHHWSRSQSRQVDLSN